MKLTKTKLTKYLKRKGSYEEVDEPLVTSLMDVLGIMETAKKSIDNDGILDENGNVSPAIRIFTSMLSEYRALTKKLGLSPFDRRQLGIENEADDGFDD